MANGLAMAATQHSVHLISAVRRRHQSQEGSGSGSGWGKRVRAGVRVTKHHLRRDIVKSWAPRDSDHEARGVLPTSWDGMKAVSDDAERSLLRGQLMASTAALLLTLGTASGAHAFVPIRGCGDPGSPYDTQVNATETSSSYGVTSCTKLYQPARAAELRAAAAVKEAAQAKDTDDGGSATLRGRITTDELGSNDSN